MSDPSPTRQPSLLRRLGLTGRTSLIVVAAFAFGLLLFLAIWWKQRNANDFFRAGGPEQPTTGEQFTPLPVPDTTVTDPGNLPSAPEPQASPTGPAPTAVAPAPMPPASVDAPPPAATDGVPATGSEAGADVAPVPVDRPSPRYPADALRRGETGDVVLRIHVDARGMAGDIDLVRGSGSRQLDRAATDAARRWRFRPALRGGQPVEGAFETTITFRL